MSRATAASAPGIDSYNNARESYNQDVHTPAFFLGSQEAPLPEMANQEQKLSYLFEVNEVAQEYAYDVDANLWWGVNGDPVYQVTNSTLTVNLFKSSDGKCYTALADSNKQSHEVYAHNSWVAWDFPSQFSRNEGGSIAIDPVTYALPSDDGSVTDNSYNTAE